MQYLKQFARFIIEKVFDVFYKKKVAYYIAQLCEGNTSVLDVGIGTGFVTLKIKEFNPKIHIIGLDIEDKTNGSVPVTIFDGKTIPFPDNSFDVVLCIDVLHHISDIGSLMKELSRVSKKYVIIKDHQRYSILSYYFLHFSDYITNAPYDINCAYNFYTKKQWLNEFHNAGLELIKEAKHLHYGYLINERYNPIYKLRKITL